MGTKRGEPARFIETAIQFCGDKCLIWPFSRGRDGRARIYLPINRDDYGRLIFKEAAVHRLICERIYGLPPPDHESAHSCGNGHLGCISPQHLRWATSLENKSDMVGHGTRARGEKNGFAKLTADDVLSIRSSEGIISRKELAQKFSINPWYVRNIQKRRSWKWL